MNSRFFVWFAVCCFVTASGTVSAQQKTGAAEPLAIVNGTPITNAEVENALGQSLAKLEEQIYELKKTKLDDLIDESLIAGEAKKRGITPDALTKAEITAKLKSWLP